MSLELTFISCIIEFFIFYDFFRAFFPKRERFTKTWTVLLIGLLFSFAYFLINIINFAGLNMITFPIFLFAFATTIFKCSIRSKLLYILFACCIFFGCEFFFLILLEIPHFVLNKSGTVDLSQMPWQFFTLKLLTYFICNIFKQISPKSTTRMDKKIFLSYLAIPFASLGIMLLTYYSEIDFRDNPQMQTMLCIFFALMQVGNIVIFYAFQRYSQEMYNNMQQRILITEQNMKLEHYTQLEALHAQNREFIHNVSNHIKTIGNLIDTERNKEALNIIKDLNIELEKGTKIVYSSNSVLNSILSDKKTVAEKNNIAMDIYVEPGVKFTSATSMDLITMLGNLLDNAIEAAIKCSEDRSIKVRIYLENDGNVCVIKITNTFDGKLQKDGERFLTTKQDGIMHGIGLKSVQKTAEKCGGTLDYFTEDNKFVAILLL